jgi:hypothetical protein
MLHHPAAGAIGMLLTFVLLLSMLMFYELQPFKYFEQKKALESIMKKYNDTKQTLIAKVHRRIQGGDDSASRWDVSPKLAIVFEHDLEITLDYTANLHDALHKIAAKTSWGHVHSFLWLDPENNSVTVSTEKEWKALKENSHNTNNRVKITQAQQAVMRRSPSPQHSTARAHSPTPPISSLKQGHNALAKLEAAYSNSSTAFLISGNIRGLICMPSLIKNGLDALDPDGDVFALVNPCDTSSHWNSRKSFGCTDLSKWSSFFRNRIHLREYNSSDNIPPGNGCSYPPPDTRAYHQYWGISRVFRMMEEYETVRHRRYQTVVKFRPDHCLVHPLLPSLKQLGFQTGEMKFVLTPECHKGPGRPVSYRCANDDFAVCPRILANAYFEGPFMQYFACSDPAEWNMHSNADLIKNPEQLVNEVFVSKALAYHHIPWKDYVWMNTNIGSKKCLTFHTDCVTAMRPELLFK